MTEPVFSAKSLEDLTAILEHIAKDSPKAAVRFVDELEERCSLLVQFPHIGTARDDLLPSLRLFTYRGYGIYYRPQADSVRIERVLHPSLDVTRQFSD